MNDDFVKQVKQLEKITGIRGQGVYATPQYQDLVRRVFGDIQVPPGSQIISQTPSVVYYKDQFGNTYKSSRNLNASLGDFGTISTQLDQGASQSSLGELDMAKNVLPTIQDLLKQYLGTNEFDTGISSILDRVKSISDRLEAPQTLGNIDPSVQSLLDQQKQAVLDRLNQQYTDQQAQLTSNLFGQGINRSSIAADQAGRLLGQQGLSTSAAMGEAAQRELAVRQFLAQLEQQNLALSAQNLLQGGQLSIQDFAALQEAQGQRVNSGLDYLKSILGNQLQRELGLGQLAIGSADQAYKERQGAIQNNFQQQMLELQRKAQQGQSLWKSILGGVASIGLNAVAPGLGTAVGSIFNRSSGGGYTPVGPGE